MDHGLKETLKTVGSVWKIKLLTVAGVDLSLGNIVVALFMLLVAARLSRLVVKILNKRIIVPFVHDEGAQITYQTFTYYVSLIVFVTIALSIAGIPLTVFTVIGGALAIGVGFGSQNIVNNFISGVILMIEKPIKVGDVVTVDGNSGKVIAINTRSTKIKNVENKVLIVPNSHLLEKSVLNSNYLTSTFRTSISFGVAYDSDVRLVEKTCMEIMLENDDIEKDPMPFVHFMDFADSNLVFEMTFYCNTRRVASLNHIKSDVRFSILERFRELKIEMAFPQRDLHLNVKAPMDVKVLS